MTTGSSIEKLERKALMHVFAKHRPSDKIVSVDIGKDCYYVRCEYHGHNQAGSYYIVEYPYSGLNGLDKEIKDAINHLKWIEDGNEFPSTT